MKNILISILVVSCLTLSAQEQQTSTARPDSHAPIGVMGDHMHKKGDFMLSYRFMTMSMNGNLLGTDKISDDEIVTTIPNRFSSMDGMPATLRVVPQDMTMNMHMFGLMYAPSDWMTLMLMGSYITKDMTLTTYMGGSGTTVLGDFDTSTSGLGDTKISALVKLWKKDKHMIFGNIGMSLPTGSITEEASVLTPMDMTTDSRVPYPMQLGSGSLELLNGITYNGKSESLSWGGQLSSVIRLNENGEGYKLGDKWMASAWAALPINSWLSTSLRGEYQYTDKIDGIDDEIMLPVQTADPDLQGGKSFYGSLGVNFIGQNGFTRNHRLAAEFSLPLYQDLNGPQMATSNILTLGWQYAF